MAHELSDGEVEQFVGIRRDIHLHPELGFEEARTSELVAGLLKSWGYQVTTGIAGTGVVGCLSRGEGRRLGIRADMDALPIQEATGLPYASKHDGVMHACGHDGHTATLLAAAKCLSEATDWLGTINLIFQPAEEGRGGARRMVDEGLFDRFPCDAIFAFHNLPGKAQGMFIFRSGPFMASTDLVTIHLDGVGGHGGLPHLAQDPVVAAASLVMGLQTVISRNVDPRGSAVLTVGQLSAGTAANVIPERATLEISIRAFDREIRATIESRVIAMAHAHAHGFGLKAEIEYRRAFPVLVNDAELTRFASEVALNLFGAERVLLEGEPITASEDFATMLEQCPGCYFMIGNDRTGSRASVMVHNSGYDFNDDNIEVGAKYWVVLARRFLAESFSAQTELPSPGNLAPAH